MCGVIISVKGHDMSVYVELVIFNNLAIDFLLIVATQILRRRKVCKIRTLVAVIIGAAIATFYPIASQGIQIAIKVCLAPIMTAIFDTYSLSKKKCTNFRKNINEVKCENDVDNSFSAKWRSANLNLKILGVKEYVKSLVIFVIATYAVGGITFGLSYLCGVDVKSYAAFGLVACAIAIMLICARVLRKKRSSDASMLTIANISVDGRKIALTGLCDSGNTLVDGVSGLPVVILSAKAEKELGKTDIEGFLHVTTVSGECDMPITLLSNFEVDGKKMSCMGALSRKEFENCDLILQNSMF